MARISEEELERIKREVAVQRLAEARGVELRRHGKDLIGLCPFHDDAKPSCSVNLAQGVWHCFACHAKGNVLEFVHRMEALRANGTTVSLRQAGLTLAPSKKLRSERLPRFHPRRVGGRPVSNYMRAQARPASAACAPGGP